jgi:hypothetical protein
MRLHEKSVGLLCQVMYEWREGQTEGRTEELLFLWMLHGDALAPRGRASCGWGLRV